MQERGCCKSQLYEDWVGGQPSAHRAPVPSSFCTASGRAGSSAGACSDASAEGSSDASDENSLNFWSLDSGFGVLGSSHCSRTQGQFEQRLRLAEHASIASGQLRFRDMLPRTCRKISLMCVVWGSRSRDLPFLAHTSSAIQHARKGILCAETGMPGRQAWQGFHELLSS